ncbi:MAG: ComF family protein [Chloroflexota bacterium]
MQRTARRQTWIERWGGVVENPTAVRRALLLLHGLALGAQDLLFPPYCAGCERVGSLLCPRCMAAITRPTPRAIPGLAEVCVCAEYDGAIGAAIRALKYGGQTRLAEPLGTLLARSLYRSGWSIDLIVPVPLHPARLRDRGYNQAKLVSLYASRALAIPVSSSAVWRVRDTPSQVDLNARERRANMKGAFESDAEIVRGRSVLVVDDVLTTGATIGACAEALRLAGAARVFGATVAGAVLSPEPAAGCG